MRDIMRREYKAYKKVGKLKKSIGELLKLEFPDYVYISPGVIKHIKKRHGKQLTKKIKDNIIEVIEEIIREPYYVGIMNKNDGSQSIELIKRVDNILLLLGLDTDMIDKYIYVATLYPITSCKVRGKLFNNRLIVLCSDEINEQIQICN